MSSHITSELEATKFAESLVRDATDYDIDGVDLDVEDSGATADIQVVQTTVYTYVKYLPHNSNLLLILVKTTPSGSL